MDVKQGLLYYPSIKSGFLRYIRVSNLFTLTACVGGKPLISQDNHTVLCNVECSIGGIIHFIGDSCLEYMITHSPVSAFRPLLHILSTMGHYQKENTDLHHLAMSNQL